MAKIKHTLCIYYPWGGSATEDNFSETNGTWKVKENYHLNSVLSSNSLLTKALSMSFYPDFILTLFRFYPDFILILSR